MRLHHLCFSIGAVAALVVAAPLAWADQPTGSTEDKEAIANGAKAFIEAFQKGDAAALAAFWTPDGEYTDLTGHTMRGREAIEKAFRGLFAEHKDLKLRIDSLSLRFVTPDVALEDGTTAVIAPDGSPPSRARYTIAHVKRDGKWQISSVRDTPFAAATNYEQLRGLEWLIGDWASEEEGGAAEHLSFEWTENQNFIIASFSTTAKNVSVGAATIWIGWDPTAKQVRSWMFDADGGFGEGTWTSEGPTWTIRSHSVLRDGKKQEATFVLTRGDGDTCTFQIKDRSVDGNKIPDSKEIKLKRPK
jgi:uncharacterized protein (TIGR02246 family)